MREERVAMNKEVTEGSTKKGAYDKKMMEMWRAYNNYDLGDNKSFTNDLVMLHHRIKHIGDYMYPKHKKEEVTLINEGIEELYGEYLKFKSTIHVLDPTYPALHKEAIKEYREKQTPARSSKDTPPKPAPKPKGRPKKDPQPETEPKPAPKPKGRPKKPKTDLKKTEFLK